MDRQETIADIIAEMRSDANADEYTPDGILGQTLNCLADRLDEAHKRERGDCAKLREALEHMVRAETYGSMERDDLCGRCLEKMFARCKHDGTCWVDKAITALAAPPRNCDRFETAEEADAAYRRFYEREIAKIPLDAVDYSRERAKIPTKDKWLFAPATEKEGGNNAD